jgi:hypothetical protein
MSSGRSPPPERTEYAPHVKRRWIYGLLGLGAIVLVAWWLIPDPGPGIPAGAHSLYRVPTEVSLRVTDAGSGRPIEGADVYVGWTHEIEDDDWRVGTRLRHPNYRSPWLSLRSAYDRTDASGRATLLALTKNCTFTSAAEEASGSGPDWLDGWAGVSVRVNAPGYEARVVRNVTQPRHERRDGRDTIVLLDLGSVALTKQTP